MSERTADDESNFERMKKTIGNGHPRAANKGKVKRRLKAERIPRKRHRGR